MQELHLFDFSKYLFIICLYIKYLSPTTHDLIKNIVNDRFIERERHRRIIKNTVYPVFLDMLASYNLRLQKTSQKPIKFLQCVQSICFDR